jgi:hypothetical protein
VGPRAILDVVVKRSEEKNLQPLPGIESNPDHPARSPAIYRLIIFSEKYKLLNSYSFYTYKNTNIDTDD